MEHFFAPRLIQALAEKLPEGFEAKFIAAEDESVDSEIAITKGGTDTGISIQIGLGAVCSVNEWIEEENGMMFGEMRPITAIDALVSDVLLKL